MLTGDSNGYKSVSPVPKWFQILLWLLHLHMGRYDGPSMSGTGCLSFPWFLRANIHLIRLDIKHEVPNRHSSLDVDDNDIHLHLPFVKLLLDSSVRSCRWRGGQIESEWKAKVMETFDLCFALASLFRIMGAKNDSNADRHCLFQVRHTWKYGCLYLLISCGTIIHRFYRQPTDREKDEQQTKMT